MDFERCDDGCEMRSRRWRWRGEKGENRMKEEGKEKCRDRMEERGGESEWSRKEGIEKEERE